VTDSRRGSTARPSGSYSTCADTGVNKRTAPGFCPPGAVPMLGCHFGHIALSARRKSHLMRGHSGSPLIRPGGCRSQRWPSGSDSPARGQAEGLLYFFRSTSREALRKQHRSRFADICCSATRQRLYCEVPGGRGLDAASRHHNGVLPRAARLRDWSSLKLPRFRSSRSRPTRRHNDEVRLGDARRGRHNQRRRLRHRSSNPKPCRRHAR
jgi:hypothetical protein